MSGPALPGRGVWMLPVRDAAGHILAAAITDDGRMVAMAPVPPGASVGAVRLALEILLDELDPPRVRPWLEVVR